MFQIEASTADRAHQVVPSFRGSLNDLIGSPDKKGIRLGVVDVECSLHVTRYCCAR